MWLGLCAEFFVCMKLLLLYLHSGLPIRHMQILKSLSHAQSNFRHPELEAPVMSKISVCVCVCVGAWLLTSCLTHHQCFREAEQTI